MNEVEPATEAIVPAIAPEDDSEAKIARIEAEKAQISEEKENYRKAYLKAIEKDDLPLEEKEEARMRKVALEAIADSRLVQINQEKDQLLTAALKENKELKLAQLNKKEPPATGTHSEGIPVQDTLVTKEQMEFFKSKGWTDKDIERYKKSLQGKR